MKKFLAQLITTLCFISLSTVASAAPVPIGFQPPTNIGITAQLPVVLRSALIIIFVIAGLAVLFMLIFGAFQWITSGGDKEAVGKARGRIVNALIGFALLALAVLIVRVVGQIVNIDIFGPSFQSVPSLNGN